MLHLPTEAVEPVVLWRAVAQLVRRKFSPAAISAAKAQTEAVGCAKPALFLPNIEKKRYYIALTCPFSFLSALPWLILPIFPT